MASTLLSTQVTSDGTAVSDAATDFGKITALNIQCKFTAGSGGTSFKVYLQTRVDGSNWYDIACFAYTNADAVQYQSVNAQAAVLTPVALTDGALADNTAVSGFIGDALRVKHVTTGTYTGAAVVVAVDAKN